MTQVIPHHWVSPLNGAVLLGDVTQWMVSADLVSESFVLDILFLRQAAEIPSPDSQNHPKTK